MTKIWVQNKISIVWLFVEEAAEYSGLPLNHVGGENLKFEHPGQLVIRFIGIRASEQFFI